MRERITAVLNAQPEKIILDQAGDSCEAIQQFRNLQPGVTSLNDDDGIRPLSYSAPRRVFIKTGCVAINFLRFAPFTMADLTFLRSTQ